MTGDRGFRTESGVARVRGGDLVVERSLRTFVSGWYARKLAEASRARATWNLLSLSLTVGTFWRFGWMLLDGLQPGLIEHLATVVVVFLPVTLAVHLYREAVRTTAVPIADVQRATVDPCEHTLTLHHEDDETDVDLRGDDDVDRAREHLRMRGVEVVETDSESNPHDEWRPWLEDDEGMPWPEDEESDRTREREGERSRSGAR
jgi:hypothetical protein